MKRLILLLVVCHSVGHAQTARDAFMASLDKFVHDHERISQEDIYVQARAAFERSPEELKKKIDGWLDSLPPAKKRDGYTLVGEFGKAATPEEADLALKDRPAAARLFLQGLTPEDVVWLAISEVESLGVLRKERQSFQAARPYIRPRIELISRTPNEVRLAIYDFDSVIELTAIRASVGVLSPAIFRILKKEPNQPLQPTAPSGRG
jgi:hypothetical protein